MWKKLIKVDENYSKLKKKKKCISHVGEMCRMQAAPLASHSMRRATLPNLHLQHHCHKLYERNIYFENLEVHQSKCLFVLWQN